MNQILSESSFCPQKSDSDPDPKRYGKSDPDLTRSKNSIFEFDQIRIYNQCCGADNISFGSGSTEPITRISAPAPATLKITFF
jgi:hypothetical protein